MALEEYNRKRDFERTREPPGEVARTSGGDSFVIQKHAATRLHYDFRLELDGVLLSWSVPKGPSLDPTVKRLAVQVEDHPLSYATFEGLIPKGQYGGGTVLLWDRGTWEPVGDVREMLAKGNLKFLLKGEKLQGKFALVKIKGRPTPRKGDSPRNWLLIKERDAEARSEAQVDITAARPESVATGRGLDEIEADPSHVWHSNRVRVDLTDVVGARAAALPARPRGATLTPRSDAPEGPAWLHEMLIDGRRLLARATLGKEVELFDADGEPLDGEEAAWFAAVADAVRLLPVEELVVDGVVTALFPDGRPRANGLAEALEGHGDGVLTYYLTDLAFLDGHDLSATPLARRKALLAELLARARPLHDSTSQSAGPLRLSEHLAGNGAAFFQQACRVGLPGIVSRRADGARGDPDAAFVLVCPSASAANG